MPASESYPRSHAPAARAPGPVRAREDRNAERRIPVFRGRRGPPRSDRAGGGTRNVPLSRRSFRSGLARNAATRRGTAARARRTGPEAGPGDAARYLRVRRDRLRQRRWHLPDVRSGREPAQAARLAPRDPQPDCPIRGRRVNRTSRPRVVVSYGAGADSTALLLRWIHEPETLAVRPWRPAGDHLHAGRPCCEIPRDRGGANCLVTRSMSRFTRRIRDGSAVARGVRARAPGHGWNPAPWALLAMLAHGRDQVPSAC